MPRLFAGLTYEQVLENYSQTIVSVCVMRLQNMTDAEDVFQNVFSKLWFKSPEFKDTEHLKAWLLRVCLNECKNYLRQNRRTISLDGISEPEVMFDESKSDLSWALMKTPEKYREVLYLYYALNYHVDEVAKILSLNPNTVKTRLKRGREKLKEIYGGE
ncbi:MAG: sigma-70 family RNA polymerase sigma factor [Alphaproteobacteria bacterium]